uniref:Leucine rich repeat protein n=1 Tax=Panagrolaimus sp. ES5 TaxID=591445 RepID=A0AC34F7W9_9BILA
MRLYCLSSISRIPPPTNFDDLPTAYEDGADEIVLSSYPSKYFLDDLTPEFRLTEICMGWKEYREGPKKSYVIQIYQTKFGNPEKSFSDLFSFAMTRGLITLSNFDRKSYSFDLYFALSKLASFYSHPQANKAPLEYDLKVHVFCVWHANNPRTLLHTQTKNFRDCVALRWANTTLKNIDCSIFNFQNLKDIQFDNADLGFELKYWHQLAAKVNFETINFISLRHCGIQKLDDKFFEYLTPELGGLLLVDNNITSISKTISKLTRLSRFELRKNKNLSDIDIGIPWNYLPTNIQRFDLDNTDITKIPSEIRRLKKLDTFIVSSFKLNNISWESLNGRIRELSIYGNIKNEMNQVELKHLDGGDLKLVNLKLKNLNASYLPRHLGSLNLKNNNLRILDLSEIIQNQRYLREITVSKNGLKKFSWQNFPKDRIKKINLSNNDLEVIPPIAPPLSFATFVNLKEISFEDNGIKSLPEGFENLPNLVDLNLSFNYFGYDGADLMEVLWLRLPKSVATLNLMYQKIDYIPCCLKNYSIKNLHVAETNLHHICPFIHANVQQNNSYMVIDASHNPFLKLSFIPSTIYKLPTKTISKPNSADAIYSYDGIPNYANFPTTTLIGDFCDTSPTNYFKSGFKFSSEGVKQDDAIICDCCASCGNSTDEPLFKQQLAMDSVLLVQKEEGVKDSKFAQFHSPFKPPILYEPGQWRTEVKSRLCVECMKVIKEKIDILFDEQTKKKKNFENKNLKENYPEMPEPSRKGRSLNTNEAFETYDEDMPQNVYYNNNEIYNDLIKEKIDILFDEQTKKKKNFENKNLNEGNPKMPEPSRKGRSLKTNEAFETYDEDMPQNVYYNNNEIYNDCEPGPSNTINTSFQQLPYQYYQDGLQDEYIPQNFYCNNETYNECEPGPSNSFIQQQLPYPNYQTLQNNFIPTPTPMHCEQNEITGFENINLEENSFYNNNPNQIYYNVPQLQQQRTILIDQDGKEIAVWEEPFNNYEIPQTNSGMQEADIIPGYYTQQYSDYTTLMPNNPDENDYEGVSFLMNNGEFERQNH